MMNKLISINSIEEIPPEYLHTPIGLLIQYHNLDKAYDIYDKAELLVSMCMDNRNHLHIPEKFAYIMRSGGANLRYSEFQVSYAIAVGQVSHIALIGHNNCGMVNLASREEELIDGLVTNAGWEREKAKEHFIKFSPIFEIGRSDDFILSEARRLRLRYPRVMIAPLFYLLEENKLYFIKE